MPVYTSFPQRFESFGRNSLCRSSSLGGQRIVYPIKASSILVYGARANRDLVGSSMFSQCLLVSMGDIETNTF